MPPGGMDSATRFSGDRVPMPGHLPLRGEFLRAASAEPVAKGLTSTKDVLSTCVSHDIQNRPNAEWGRRRDCDLTGRGDPSPRAEVE
jgi:hypothetical protein